jgi:hypothetical protein
MLNNKKDVLYLSDTDEITTTFKTEVYDNDTVVPIANFSDAVYYIKTLDNKVVYTSSIGTGISIDGNQFVIKAKATVPPGRYQHYLIVTNATGEKLPPVFIRKLEIRKV